MYGLFYSAIDIALVLRDMNLGCREESKILDLIWNNDAKLLSESYRENKRKFILDTYHWMHYIFDKAAIDMELASIQRDFEHTNKTLQINQLSSEFSDFDLFFKSARIKMLYGGSDYVRIKLRTLLNKYGYKRRSPLIIQYIRSCMDFYKLEVNRRGAIPCSIDNVRLDEMLIFRAIS